MFTVLALASTRTSDLVQNRDIVRQDAAHVLYALLDGVDD
jgi:hypothetical protein